MDIQIIFVFFLVAVVFIAFIREKIPADVIAISSAAALLVFGIISTQEFLSVFSNSAPITIAMMFIISAALERTGCLKILGKYIFRLAGQSYLRAMLVIMFVVMLASAFMNNTPVVIVMTPIVISLAKSLNMQPSKMLIPLSFAAIFGGTTTLVGTSTNILVAGIAEEYNLFEIGMFEMTLPGLIFAAFGMTYMLLAGKYLLPDRYSLSNLLDSQPKRQFWAELVIAENSEYIGKKIAEINLNLENSKIIDVIRNGKPQQPVLDEILLQKSDRVVIETSAGEVIGFNQKEKSGFQSLSKNFATVSADEKMVMEGSISLHSKLIGKRISNLHFRRKFGAYILAIHRNNDILEENYGQLKLQFGDTLLIEGNVQNIKRLMEEGDLINLNQTQEKPVLTTKAPIAIGVILGVMLLSAIGAMPIAGLAFIGAAIVMLTGCVDVDDAYKSIEWRLLFLIFGMLGLSMGMENTGAAELLISKIVNFIDDINPIFILAMLYVFTSILTELISNNAVAVLVAPIAIGLAAQLGLDPKPFIMAVMFAASASFATPIGYQTNTFVYSAGGYKFSDFIKVGVPLNILFAILATIILPMFYPF